MAKRKAFAGSSSNNKQSKNGNKSEKKTPPKNGEKKMPTPQEIRAEIKKKLLQTEFDAPEYVECVYLMFTNSLNILQLVSRTAAMVCSTRNRQANDPINVQLGGILPPEICYLLCELTDDERKAFANKSEKKLQKLVIEPDYYNHRIWYRLLS